MIQEDRRTTIRRISKSLNNMLRYYSLNFKLRKIVREVLRNNLTFLSRNKLAILATLCTVLEKQNVEGAIVEAGCALGGSSIVLASAKSQDRDLMIYDVFEMIPPPTDKDGPDARERFHVITSGNSKGIGGDPYYGYRGNLYDQVKKNLSDFNCDPEKNRICLIKGLVQQTLNVNQRVCLAHIDVDWYEPVMVCLERIAPKLVTGGYIVVDDYFDWTGCRRAVDEYFGNRDDLCKYRFDAPAGSLVVCRVK